MSSEAAHPQYLWTAYNLHPDREYRFHRKRLWRLDFAWPERMVGVEIEGGIWMKGATGRGGAHSLPSNIIRDMEKHNEATRLGWRIFRFTPTELHKGIAQAFMITVLSGGKGV